MSQLHTYLFMGFFFLICLPYSCSQPTSGDRNPLGIQVQNPEFNQKLVDLLQFDVPVISVDSLDHHQEDFILLDIRSPEEYEVSHIGDAHFVDFDKPDFSVVAHLSKVTPIVVYCSVGYRSEMIGKRLLEKGFTSVYNLYGGIFEWVNAGYPVVDARDRSTDSIHTYNRRWSRYVYNPNMKKIW